MARSTKRQIGYAVVGLGHIAQSAMLPAFANANENSRLVALVSDSREKRRELQKKYGVPHTYSYAEYEDCLRNEEVDAVYIALPNSMHADFTVRAAKAGVHVLCEKPMALTERECRQMIAACDDAGVKLMIAYRLHLEPAHLEAVELARSGRLGELRFFSSDFSMRVRPGNIRVQRELGGGPLGDIGIYCINASRYLFRSEPLEVSAFAARGRDPRFREVDEAVSVIMRFPDERLATFTCSFGASSVGSLRLVGTKGDYRMENAYDYAGERTRWLTTSQGTEPRTFPPSDQFGPQLTYFSRCILSNRDPEPSGKEGLADLRVMKAIYKSVDLRRAVRVEAVPRKRRPEAAQLIRKQKVSEPRLVNVEPPHAG
ncbi:MAG: Gfo/Idh/MocA family protein [Myxococcales bacterium]